MRAWVCSLFLLLPQPLAAEEMAAPYYGPRLGLFQGGVGYRDKLEKDGSWRVDATANGDHALDIAMYRAAELARDQGHAYVQFLGGMGHRFQVSYSATVWIKPTDDPAAPTACQSKRPGSCYTADVVELLRVLGGPDGTQPGVPITDHRDEYGRAVSISGFGIAPAVMSGVRRVPTPPMSLVPAVPVLRAITPPAPSSSLARQSSRVAAVPAASDDRASIYDKRQEAEQGIHGREPKQGWTIGD